MNTITQARQDLTETNRLHEGFNQTPLSHGIHETIYGVEEKMNDIFTSFDAMSLNNTVDMQLAELFHLPDNKKKELIKILEAENTLPLSVTDVLNIGQKNYWSNSH